MAGAAEDGFLPHPQARLFGPDGQKVALPQLQAANRPAVLPDRPALPALLAAFGQSFRIGAPEAPAPVTGFETLTSGSTGTPRRIARSFASWQAGFAVNAALFGTGTGARVGVIGRLSQSLALHGAVEALALGAELHLLDCLRPDRQRAELARRGVTLLWAAPAQLHLLTEAPGPDLPALRWLLCGGAKLDSALRARVARLAPHAALREFFGAAETSFITLADAETPPETVGRPYPGVEIRLCDMSGQPANEGRVQVRSPYLFNGYASDPGSARWLAGAGGWLDLPEIARWEGANLRLLGRRDRMFTVAGQNLYPEAQESFALGLPGVARFALLPRPDGLRGQRPEAVVMGDATCAAVILQALRAEFGATLAPRCLHWRADWPLLPSGKTDLAALMRGLE
ncbi:AMP-binding protein [Szabonella alba]|uniref:AMP-binding protein n=1 Tax=Szabonella alba TaxID=2804194 RepID=A0A8K0VBV5_9RHOB|nr:AMP-binding protein [Szabonella alba]MBL4918851.1 AMP-binding protein [Szabonella alba]